MEFTTLDLRQAFHRFQIYKPDRVKTTFTFQGQQYMFKGCPFGLKHIASRYQRVINSILADVPHALAFVDDIIIFSKSYEEHITHVQNVIKKLTNVNLILNVDKCHFAQRFNFKKKLIVMNIKSFFLRSVEYLSLWMAFPKKVRL